MNNITPAQRHAQTSTAESRKHDKGPWFIESQNREDAIITCHKQEAASIIIQKYARRLIVCQTLARIEGEFGKMHIDPADWYASSEEDFSLHGVEDSPYWQAEQIVKQEQWDEKGLVQETFGRHTYNFSGGTGIGPIYQQTSHIDLSDNEGEEDGMEIDYS